MQRARFFFVAFLFVIEQTSGIGPNNEIAGTFNRINKLQKEIQNNIDILNNRIPRIATNLNTNIQRISSKSKIPEIISSLKTQIPENSECGRNASNYINSLKFSSRADISECVEEAVAKSGSVIQQATILLQKVIEVRNDVGGRIAGCVKNNLANEVNLVLCLVAQVFPIEESVGSLGNEIETTLGVTEQTAEDIGIGLIQCITGFENIVTEESKNILYLYKNCTTNV